MRIFTRAAQGCCLLVVIVAILLVIAIPDFFRVAAEVFLDLNRR